MRVGILALLLLLGAVPTAQADFASYAIVQADGTLKVAGRSVHLYGIHIPDAGRHCRTSVRPVRCGSRAAVALDTKIQGFVRCREMGRNRDRSLNAVCWVDYSLRTGGEDLGAWLISQGWAVARPEASFDYVTRERIARARGKGVWGFQADSIRRR